MSEERPQYFTFDGHLGVEKYISSCNDAKVDPKRTVFIFPGNPSHHTNYGLYSVKEGAKLGKVAEDLGLTGVPTLSLPTRDMPTVTNPDEIPDLAKKAVADLWRAVGYGMNIVLPVRKHDNTEYFDKAFADGTEPNFWGGVVTTSNKLLGNYYLIELERLQQFMKGEISLPKEYKEAYNQGQKQLKGNQNDDWFHAKEITKKHDVDKPIIFSSTEKPVKKNNQPKEFGHKKLQQSHFNPDVQITVKQLPCTDPNTKENYTIEGIIPLKLFQDRVDKLQSHFAEKQKSAPLKPMEQTKTIDKYQVNSIEDLVKLSQIICHKPDNKKIQVAFHFEGSNVKVGRADSPDAVLTELDGKTFAETYQSIAYRLTKAAEDLSRYFKDDTDKGVQYLLEDGERYAYLKNHVAYLRNVRDMLSKYISDYKDGTKDIAESDIEKLLLKFKILDGRELHYINEEIHVDNFAKLEDVLSSIEQDIYGYEQYDTLQRIRSSEYADFFLAEMMIELIHGNGTSGKWGTYWFPEPEPSKSGKGKSQTLTFSEYDKPYEHLYGIKQLVAEAAVLLFAVEPSRDSASLGTSMLILELIQNEVSYGRERDEFRELHPESGNARKPFLWRNTLDSAKLTEKGWMIKESDSGLPKKLSEKGYHTVNPYGSAMGEKLAPYPRHFLDGMAKAKTVIDKAIVYNKIKEKLAFVDKLKGGKHPVTTSATMQLQQHEMSTGEEITNAGIYDYRKKILDAFDSEKITSYLVDHRVLLKEVSLLINYLENMAPDVSEGDFFQVIQDIEKFFTSELNEFYGTNLPPRNILDPQNDEDQALQDALLRIYNKSFSLDETRLYRDDDIDDYLSIYIDKHFEGFQGKYLVNTKQVEKITGDPNLLLAITPAVDVYGKSIRVDYFFNKQSLSKNALATNLENLLEEKNWQALEKALSKYEKFDLPELKKEIQTIFGEENIDGDTAIFIAKELVSLKFNKEAITMRIKEMHSKVDNRDVFDDLMPLLKDDPTKAARVLMPYNHQGRNHWLTCEVNITRSHEGDYLVEVFTHDPYGEGKMSEANFDLLQKAINERILSFYSEEMVIPNITITNKASPFTRRQAKGDTNSCGVITIEDVLKRAVNRAPDEDGEYAMNATKLRENHVKAIKLYQLEKGKTDRGRHFLDRSLKKSSFDPDYQPSHSKSYSYAYGSYDDTEDKMQRLFTDEDINDILEINISGKIGYQPKHKYLLNPDKSKPNQLLAVTPAIDVLGRSLNLDHFINKQSFSRSIIAEHLERLLPKLDELAKVEDLSAAVKKELKGADPEAADFVATKLIEYDFKLEELQKYIKEIDSNIDNRDVLDEIIPKIKANGDFTATILSPYNHEERNHWLTCQINIRRVDNHYYIDIFAHDPYGNGQMPKDNFELLQKTLLERIASFHKGEEVQLYATFTNPKSDYARRQKSGDTNSCGVIVTEDIISIIEGSRPDANGEYQLYAPELRQKHVDSVKEYQSFTGDKKRGKNFLLRNDITNNSKELKKDELIQFDAKLQEILSKFENKAVVSAIESAFLNEEAYAEHDGSYAAMIRSLLENLPQQLLLEKSISLSDNDLSQLKAIYNELFDTNGVPKINIERLFDIEKDRPAREQTKKKQKVSCKPSEDITQLKKDSDDDPNNDSSKKPPTDSSLSLGSFGFGQSHDISTFPTTSVTKDTLKDQLQHAGKLESEFHELRRSQNLKRKKDWNSVERGQSLSDTMLDQSVTKQPTVELPSITHDSTSKKRSLTEIISEKQAQKEQDSIQKIDRVIIHYK